MLSVWQSEHTRAFITLYYSRLKLELMYKKISYWKNKIESWLVFGWKILKLDPTFSEYNYKYFLLEQFAKNRLRIISVISSFTRYWLTSKSTWDSRLTQKTSGLKFSNQSPLYRLIKSMILLNSTKWRLIKNNLTRKIDLNFHFYYQLFN